MPQNHYDVLGISPKASREEIKAAYRKLALTLHPDVNKSPDAEERFKQINIASSTLSDPAKRTEYDQSITPKQTGYTNTTHSTNYHTNYNTSPPPYMDKTQIWANLAYNAGVYFTYRNDSSARAEEIRTTAASRAVADGVILLIDWLFDQFNKR